MTTRARRGGALPLLLLAGALLGCDGEATAPTVEEERLSLLPETVELDTIRTAMLTLRNEGTRTLGPLAVEGEVHRAGEAAPLPGATVVVSSVQIPMLAPGAEIHLGVTVMLPSPVPPGPYTARITAAAGAASATSELRMRVPDPPPPPPPPETATLEIVEAPDSVRQGDIVQLRAVVHDASGSPVADPEIEWRLLPPGGGLITETGSFVGYDPGTLSVIAASSGAADTVALVVEARTRSGSFQVLGHGPLSDRFTSDLWVHGDHAYTGTWNTRAGVEGNTLYVWDISDPAAPALTDSVQVAARTVNDVKVSADGRLAVITHEGSSPNGITLLDLEDPAHPRIITRFTEGLEPGVHNVWIEGQHIYVAVPPRGLRIVDVSDPEQPRTVASYYAGSSILHDVYVRDGLAFLSHWDAGLVILDVGHGIAGGSPANPREVSRIMLDGQTHNAWYWPEAGYVFVGEEDFGIAPGIMHVVDVRDLSSPREVATFGLPGDPPHNFWLDEAEAILYMAWYSNGLRALDVGGELLGDLGRQGREVAFSRYGQAGPCPGGPFGTTCTWAPQLHRGIIWVSDLNSGLFSLRPDL